MQWRTQWFVRIAPSQGEWDRWFAWHPVVVPIKGGAARLIWLEVVKRRWSASRYLKRHYRLPDISDAQVAGEIAKEAAGKAAQEGDEAGGRKRGSL
jgi:hypothetical protein